MKITNSPCRTTLQLWILTLGHRRYQRILQSNEFDTGAQSREKIHAGFGINESNDSASSSTTRPFQAIVEDEDDHEIKDTESDPAPEDDPHPNVLRGDGSSIKTHDDMCLPGLR